MENTGKGEIVNFHTDVVNDVCWNPKRKGQLADCGWDFSANIYSLS